MDRGKENNNVIDFSKSGDSSAKFQKGNQSSQYFFPPETPKSIQWLVKYSGGLIKNELQAAYFSLGLIIFFVIISLFLIFGGRSQGGRRKIFTPPAEAPIEEVVPPKS